MPSFSMQPQCNPLVIYSALAFFWDSETVMKRFKASCVVLPGCSIFLRLHFPCEQHERNMSYNSWQKILFFHNHFINRNRHKFKISFAFPELNKVCLQKYNFLILRCLFSSRIDRYQVLKHHRLNLPLTENNFSHSMFQSMVLDFIL